MLKLSLIYFTLVEEVFPELSVTSKKQEIDITSMVVRHLELLTTLNFSGYTVTDKGADMLAEILLRTISLEKFDVSNTTLCVSKTNTINNALKNVSSLIVFELSNNGIDDTAASSVAAVICSNCLIEKLNLSHNKFSSTGILQIVMALSKNNRVKELDISNNFITPDNIEDIASILSRYLTLEKLNISSNLLKFTSVLKFTQCFRHHLNLQSLNLSNNVILFYSACEFIVDMVLSVNQNLVDLNVCGRNIRPRFTEEYLSPPNDEKSPKGFSFQNLYLLHNCSLNSLIIQKNFIKVTESCPLAVDDIMSYYVDCDGGTFYCHHHNFGVVVPPGAVSQGDYVEIQVTASYFGPYELPNGFYPISSFFWLSANYTFKIPVYIIMNHYAKIRSLEDIDHLYVLRTNACDSTVDGKKLLMSVVPNGVYFDYETSYCMVATNHFCSFCQVKNDLRIPEYLVASFSTYEDIAEVCFCPPSSECMKVTSINCIKKLCTCS